MWILKTERRLSSGMCSKKDNYYVNILGTVPFAVVKEN